MTAASKQGGGPLPANASRVAKSRDNATVMFENIVCFFCPIEGCFVSIFGRLWSQNTGGRVARNSENNARGKPG